MRRVWQFPDVWHTARFVARVAEIANERGHHPDLVWRGCAVTVASVTHDAAGAVTDQDRGLLAALDGAAAELGGLPG